MTDLEIFIILEDRLTNFWVKKSREYCWKKVDQNECFFVRGFLVLKGNLVISLVMYF